MGLSDPFDATYAGAYKSGSAWGDAVKGIGSNVSDNIKLQKQRNYIESEKKKKLENTSKMLKNVGIITEKDIPPTDDELKKGLQDEAVKHGVNQLSFMESDNPEETRRSIENAYKVYGLPMPKGKKDMVFDAKRASELGMDYDADTGDLKFKPSKDLTSMFGLSGVPEGMEVVGYDQKGKPMIRKEKRDIPAEKLDIANSDKKKAQEEKSQFVLDSANDTLSTIGEVEKGIDNFGLTGNLPSIPGTDRKNWEVNVNKLLSGKIIDVMTKMKEASKTGSTGFGQLSNKELQVLQNASTALKKDLSKEDAKRYLNDMKTAVQKVVDNKSGPSNSQVFSINGKTYNIPADQVDEFKKDMGL